MSTSYEARSVSDDAEYAKRFAYELKRRKSNLCVRYKEWAWTVDKARLDEQLLVLTDEVVRRLKPVTEEIGFILLQDCLCDFSGSFGDTGLSEPCVSIFLRASQLARVVVALRQVEDFKLEDLPQPFVSSYEKLSLRRHHIVLSPSGWLP